MYIKIYCDIMNYLDSKFISFIGILISPFLSYVVYLFYYLRSINKSAKYMFYRNIKSNNKNELLNSFFYFKHKIKNLKELIDKIEVIYRTNYFGNCSKIIIDYQNKIYNINIIISIIESFLKYYKSISNLNEFEIEDSFYVKIKNNEIYFESNNSEIQNEFIKYLKQNNITLNEFKFNIYV